MTVSERLRELEREAKRMSAGHGHAYVPYAVIDALPLIADVVEAAERQGSGVAIIRALGFVGNAHYCPDCMNHFHEDHGQHEPGCLVLAEILSDEEWPDLIPSRALTALRDALDGNTDFEWEQQEC